MDFQTVWAAFIATSSPALPPVAWVRVALPLFWAVVLMFAVLFVTKSLAKPRGRWIAPVVAAWALVPGPWSPTYWLGLAFQLPSLMTVGLCAAALIASLFTRRSAGLPRPHSGTNVALQSLGILLGWLLLLDTFLVLPFSLYRWGYSPAMLALLSILAVMIWAFGSAQWRANGAVWVLMVLAVFVVTRLPSGNVFDAVIDPWLWFALHVAAFKRWRTNRAAQPI